MSEPFEVDDRVVSPFGEAILLRMSRGQGLVRQMDGQVNEFPLSELLHSRQTREWPMLDTHPVTGEYSPLPPEHLHYRKPKT